MEVKMCSLGSGASDPWLPADLCMAVSFPALPLHQAGTSVSLHSVILFFLLSPNFLTRFAELVPLFARSPAGPEQLFDCSQSHSGFVPFVYAAPGS